MSITYKYTAYIETELESLVGMTIFNVDKTYTIKSVCKDVFLVNPTDENIIDTTTNILLTLEDIVDGKFKLYLPNDYYPGCNGGSFQLEFDDYLINKWR
jgi:hypothetical protein